MELGWSSTLARLNGRSREGLCHKPRPGVPATWPVQSSSTSVSPMSRSHERTDLGPGGYGYRRATLVVAATLGVAVVAGCPKRRELPPDPAGMKRAEGGKLSIPLPEGWEQLVEGAESIEDTVKRGGVSIVNKRRDALHGGVIVVDVGEATTRSWRQSECKGVADELGPKFGPTIEGPTIGELPTGQACHFALKNEQGVIHEYYYLAGRPPIITVCRTTGPSPAVAEDCKHVASWMRRKR